MGMWQQKEHAYRKIQSDLTSGKLPSVILLYGREQYLVDWAIDLIVKEYIEPATKTMDFIRIDEDELDGQSLYDSVVSSCETLPMFSGKKVVVLRANKLLAGEEGRGAGKDADAISDYLEAIPETTLLIVRSESANGRKKLFKTITRVGKAYEFDDLSREELNSFVLKRFKAAGVDVSSGVMKVIIEETGYYNRDSEYNLYALNNDVTKMMALAKEDKSNSPIVTEEIARSTIEGDLESSGISFINYLCEGEKDKAFSLLNNILYEDSDGFRLVALMVSQFELILGIREMLDDGVIPSVIQSKMGLPKWRYDKLKPFAHRYTVKKLRDILIKIYEIDRNIKTGALNSRIALEMVIASI